MKEAAGKLLGKAARSVRAAELLSAAGEHEFACARAYYAMLYCAQALLTEKGVSFKKHGSVHSAFGEHFVKTGIMDAKFHRWLLDAYDERVLGDYGVEVSLEAG